MPDLLPNDNLLGTIIATIAIIISVVSALQTRLLAKRTARLTLEKDRRDWGDKVVDCFGKVEQLSLSKKSVTERREAASLYATELAGLADKGKSRFPNDLTSGYGSNKEPAYQGLRQDILNHIIAAHDTLVAAYLAGDGASASLQLNHDAFVKHKRQFVSELQKITQIRNDIEWSRGRNS